MVELIGPSLPASGILLTSGLSSAEDVEDWVRDLAIYRWASKGVTALHQFRIEIRDATGFPPLYGDENGLVEVLATSKSLTKHNYGTYTVWSNRKGGPSEFVAVLALYRRSLSVTVWALNNDFSAFIDYLKKNTPTKPSGIPNGRNMRFINFAGTSGVNKEVRRISCHTWSSIEANYAAGTRNALGKLVTVNAPVGSGRLVLMHGVPGTGKSHAIRMLSEEWQKWASLSYILDPEALLNNPTYLSQVVDNDPYNSERMDEDDYDDGIAKWSVLILEDAGDFIARDAEAASGLAFGRLLNVADGMLGEGFNTILIITTNERLDLHRAISRPGRCLADIEFGLLSIAEANAWLDTNKSDKRVDHPTSLADLYNMIGPGTITNEKTDSVGFRRGT